MYKCVGHGFDSKGRKFKVYVLKGGLIVKWGYVDSRERADALAFCKRTVPELAKYIIRNGGELLDFEHDAEHWRYEDDEYHDWREHALAEHKAKLKANGACVVIDYI